MCLRISYSIKQVCNTCTQVEVGPQSFQKIKMLGRGDVGKVYLVREKKTGKLFAMKGESRCSDVIGRSECRRQSCQRRK